MTFFRRHARATRSRSMAKPVTGLLALAVLVTATFAGSALSAQATIDLGGAESFGALSFTAMTNAGADTVVHGDIGSATSIDAGVTHPGYAAYGPGDIELANAQAGLLMAYNFAEAQTPTGDITGVNLAGQTLAPGVYNSTSGILISGPIALTLDGGGDPSAVFIFQAASSGDLTVDPTSSVTYTNGAQPCNVFWKVNSAFLKNTNQTFVGTILALTQITLTENITVEGRVLARNADVTFIHDTVNKPTCTTPPDDTPPPVTPPPTPPPGDTPPPTPPPGDTTPPPVTPPPPGDTPPPVTPPPGDTTPPAVTPPPPGGTTSPPGATTPAGGTTPPAGSTTPPAGSTTPPAETPTPPATTATPPSTTTPAVPREAVATPKPATTPKPAAKAKSAAKKSTTTAKRQVGTSSGHARAPQGHVGLTG